MNKLNVDLSVNKLKENLSKLEEMIDKHWTGGYYNSQYDDKAAKGNDVNIDVVMALIYGESGDDRKYNLSSERSIKTIAKIIEVFEKYFPVNQNDAKFNIGPNIGRYPYDEYDGDITDDSYDQGHPWFISTIVMAYCFYKICKYGKKDGKVLEITKKALKLENSISFDAIKYGNKFILAVMKHWEKCSMSEQYDRETGFMKSVRDLSWSYAAYIMAHWEYKTIDKK